MQIIFKYVLKCLRKYIYNNYIAMPLISGFYFKGYTCGLVILNTHLKLYPLECKSKYIDSIVRTSEE